MEGFQSQLLRQQKIPQLLHLGLTETRQAIEGKSIPR